MDIEKYQALLTIIEQGSFTMAAQRLDYTTSGLSRLVQSLEEETGCQLLRRSRQGVLPTADCEALLPAIRELLASSAKFRERLGALRGLEFGQVAIGTAYPCFYEKLAKSSQLFHQKYPHIQISLKNGYSTELARNVEQGQLDLALISERQGSFDWQPLLDDRMVAWVPEDWSLAKEKSIPLSAFAEHPYIDIFAGLDVDNQHIFEHHHIAPRTCFTATDSHAAYAMVAAGLGLAMNNSLNSLGRQGKVKILPLEPDISLSIGIAIVSPPSHAAKMFLEKMLVASE